MKSMSPEFIEQKVDWRLRGAGSWGGGGGIWSYSLIVTISVWGDGEVLEIESGDGCITL